MTSTDSTVQEITGHLNFVRWEASSDVEGEPIVQIDVVAREN